MVELLFLFLFYLSLSLAQQSCYWFNGTELTPSNNQYNYTACFDGQNSQCCAETDVCLSSGLCFSGNQGQLYRGACTDRSWKSSACPQYCVDSIPGGANIVPCPMNANGQWLYWCGQNSETNWCQQAANASLFEYPSGTALTIVGSNSSASGTCSSSSSSGTAAATSSLAPLQSCTEAQKQIDMMGVKVGIGVGVPLLVSALLLLVLWLLERKSRQKLSQQRISEAVPKRVENESLGMAASIAPIYELVGQMEPSELPSKRGTIQRPKPGTA